MKKSVLLFALISAMALTACGGKKTENVETESAAPAAVSGGPAADAIEESKPAAKTPAAPVVDLPEEYDQLFYEGTITALDGAVATVKGSDGSMKFDISRAEADSDTAFVRGCYIEVSYADAPSNDIYPGDSASVLMDCEQYADSENRDPVVYGTFRMKDINELVIIDDTGMEVTLDNNMSRTVAFNELKPGDDVIVTYCGTLHPDKEADEEGFFAKTAYAIKIVASDAADSEEALANYIDGTIYSLDSVTKELSTDMTDFAVSGDDAVFAGLKEEDKVRVYYKGSLTGIEIEATKIEKR